MNVQHEIKAVRAQFKAVTDAPAGTFDAIVSVFGNVDLGGDRVMPGAFAKTLDEWQSSGDPIPVIWSHEWDDPMSHIGYVEKAEERPEGLFVRARLDVANNERAAYVARLLKERRVREFSFGYYAKDSELVEDPDYGTVRQLKEIDLFEVGPTLLGMNPDTVLLEAASRTWRKATPEEIREGRFAEWDASGGTARGQIEHIMTDGTLGVPGTDFAITATPEDPAVLLRVWRQDEGDDYWEPTEVLVGHRASELRMIDPLPMNNDSPDDSPDDLSLKATAVETKIAAPGWLQANARQGLEWYEEGLAGDGVVARTVREARQMAGGFVSEEKATRMAAWFARHMVDLDAPSADPDHPDFPSPGVVAHALWGGGTRRESERAMSWAEANRPESAARVYVDEKAWRAGADPDLPIAARDAWDGDAAAARVFAWAGFDSDNPSPERARRAFLVYDDEAPELRGSYKLGFADVIDGELYAIDAGLRAAASRLPQTDASAESLARARRVLDRYFARLEENSLKSLDDADADVPRDTPPTIDNERLVSLLARPRYTEE